jgi:prephenate dehydrogenase
MGLKGAKVGIIGGTGRMGSWFARLLEAQGVAALCAGRSSELSPREVVRQCRIIAVSVPIPATTVVIREIGPLVPREGLLMDLTSVKKDPLDAMLRYSRSQVVGLHPLFGPEAEPKDLRIAVCPGRGKEGLDWIRGILQKSGIKTILLDPAVHDRMMGLIQGGTHFSTLAMAVSIADSGHGMKDFLDCSTPVFRLYLDRIRAMLRQPAGLFESLLMDNPFAADSLKIHMESCTRMAGIIRNGNRKAFQEMFASLQDFFGREENES